MKYLEVPEFFKYDLSVIQSFTEHAEQSHKNYSSNVCTLRFEYWKSFWNSPINQKLFDKSLDDIVNIFDGINFENNIYWLDVKQVKFLEQTDKEKLLKKIINTFKYPSKLGILYLPNYETVILINFDLSMLLFYNSQSNNFKNIIELFSSIGLRTDI